MAPLKVVVDGVRTYYIGGEKVRGWVLFEPERDQDAGTVTVSFYGFLSSMTP